MKKLFLIFVLVVFSLSQVEAKIFGSSREKLTAGAKVAAIKEKTSSLKEALTQKLEGLPKKKLIAITAGLFAISAVVIPITTGAATTAVTGTAMLPTTTLILLKKIISMIDKKIEEIKKFLKTLKKTVEIPIKITQDQLESISNTIATLINNLKDLKEKVPLRIKSLTESEKKQLEKNMQNFDKTLKETKEVFKKIPLERPGNPSSLGSKESIVEKFNKILTDWESLKNQLTKFFTKGRES